MSEGKSCEKPQVAGCIVAMIEGHGRGQYASFASCRTADSKVCASPAESMMPVCRGGTRNNARAGGRIAPGLVACGVVFGFLTVGRAAAQDRLSRVEWFIEGGGSFFNLGDQSGSVQVPQQLLPPPVQIIVSAEGTILSPNHFSSSSLIVTGLRYHLSESDALEASYCMRYGNRFGINLTQTGSVTSSGFEQNTWSLGYARYLADRKRWRPFLVAGLGSVQSTSSVTGLNRSNVSFDFGLGADLRLNDRIALRFETRDYVAHLPSPLRGFSHDLAPSAGLVFTSRSSARRPAAFPQIEIFLEAGPSVLTGGAGPGPPVGILFSNGSPGQSQDSVINGTFSKTGRVMAGFRVFLTNNDALEFTYSQGPTRYQIQQVTTGTPVIRFQPAQVTVWLHEIPVNYVRYLGGTERLRPFVTTGLGYARFAGFFQDINRLSWNLGAGADVRLQDRLALRLEIRDFIVGQPDPLHGVTHNLAPTVGLALRFK